MGSFDDQLWPVYGAILMLGGFLVGVILSMGDFDEPRLLYNGWYQLTGVGVGVLGLFWLVAKLQGRIVRRLQFCLVVSLMAHIAMAYYLKDRYVVLGNIASRAGTRTAAEGQHFEYISAPDYHWQHIDGTDAPAASRESATDAVHVPIPELQAARPLAAPSSHRSLPAQLPPDHRDIPDPQQPDPLQLRRAETAASPTSAEALAMARITRQELDRPVVSPAPTAQPQAPRPAQESLDPPRPQAAEAERLGQPLDFQPEVPPVESAQVGLPLPADSTRRAETASQPTVARNDRGPIQRSGAATPGPKPDAHVTQPSSLARAESQNQPEARRAATGRPSALDIATELRPGQARAPDSPLASVPGVGVPVPDPRVAGPRVPASTTEPGELLSRQQLIRSASSLPSIAPDALATTESMPAGPAASTTAEGPAASALAALDARNVAPANNPPIPNVGLPAAQPRQLAGLPELGPPVPAGQASRPGRPVVASAAPVQPGSPRATAPGRSDLAPPVGALAGKALVDVPATSPGDLPPAAAGGSREPVQAGSDLERLLTPDRGSLPRQTGSPPVEIAGLTGIGGLDTSPEALLTAPDRRAPSGPEAVHAPASRLATARTDGTASMESRLREMAKESFHQRDPNTRGRTAQAYGGSVETELAVEMGLDYLNRQQYSDGHWSLDRFPADGPGYENAAPGQMNADTAATGLALLAYLGAGYTHREQKYRSVVRRGIDWLAANQQADGRLFTEKSDQTIYGRIYGHGIATIALCEAYGMTKDPDLRLPAQRAIQFILDAQQPTQGGWRYEPRLESDTSVSGWQLMALRSAQMAGLTVPTENLVKVGRWLDQAQAEGGSRYRYNPNASNTPEQRQGRVPNRTMTAEGLLMRMYLGWQRDNPALIEGAEFLKANLPQNGKRGEWLRDAYYWYYASQVMFHMQGSYWAAWNNHLRPVLEKSQVQTGPLAGSWDPNDPVPDRWAHAAGRHYVTCLDLLMMEVYYRHLPLYRTLVK